MSCPANNLQNVAKKIPYEFKCCDLFLSFPYARAEGPLKRSALIEALGLSPETGLILEPVLEEIVLNIINMCQLINYIQSNSSNATQMQAKNGDTRLRKESRRKDIWIPACAGMTCGERFTAIRNILNNITGT